MKQRALIIDIDHTLADPTHREWLFNMEPKDWDLIHQNASLDKVNEWCKNIVVNYHKLGYKILFITGRNEKYYGQTHDWLTNNLPIDILFTLHMRKDNDLRQDFVVKEEIYMKDVVEYYDVEFAVDDKQSVIDMWRRNGLTALQCADRI